MSQLKRQIRSYTPEFRLQAVRLVIDEKISIRKAASDLGISENTLYGWVKMFSNGTWKFEGLKARSSMPQIKNKTIYSISSDQMKIQELERQLRRMTMERDILKKAMAYCMELPK
jgi:transposase